MYFKSILRSGRQFFFNPSARPDTKMSPFKSDSKFDFQTELLLPMGKHSSPEILANKNVIKR